MLEDLQKYITPVKLHSENTFSRNIRRMLECSNDSEFVHNFCECVLNTAGDLLDDFLPQVFENMEYSMHMEDVLGDAQMQECMCSWCEKDTINPLAFLVLSCFFEKGDITIFATSGFTPYVVQDFLEGVFSEYSFEKEYIKFIEEQLLPNYDFMTQEGTIDTDSFAGDAAVIGVSLKNFEKKEIFEDIMENLFEFSLTVENCYCCDTWENEQACLISYYQVWSKLDEYLECVPKKREDLLYDRVAAQFEEETDLTELVQKILNVKSSFKEVLF